MYFGVDTITPSHNVHETDLTYGARLQYEPCEQVGSCTKTHPRSLFVINLANDVILR